MVKENNINPIQSNPIQSNPIQSNPIPSTQKYLILLFLLSMCTYYYFSNNDAPFFGGDTTQYLEVAQDIKDFNIDKIHYRSIGFPILLVLTGSEEIPTKLFFLLSLILYSVCIFIVSIFFLKLNFKFSLILLICFILALPFFVQNCTMVMSENFTTFTLMLGFIFFIKGFVFRGYLNMILASIFWGFSAIIRPTFQFLILPILCVIFLYYILLEKKSIYSSIKFTIKRSFLFSIIFLFIILINCSINHFLFNYFGLTPLFGITLSTRTVTFVEELPDSFKKEREILVKYRDRSLVRGKSHSALVYIEDAIPELMDSTGLNFVQLSKHMEKLNLLLIKKAPMKYLRLVGIAGVTYWFPFATNLIVQNKIIEYLNILVWTIVVILYFIQLFFLIVIIICMIFSIHLIRNDLKLFLYSNVKYLFSLLVLNVIVIYNFFVTILLSVGEPRHRSPTDIFIIMSIFLIFAIYKKYKVFLKADSSKLN